MPRVAKPYDPIRIDQLKNQIRDPAYVDGAIDRLAGRITDKLLGLDEQPMRADRNGYRRASSSSMESALLLRDEG
jgi:hypothetical protein